MRDDNFIRLHLRAYVCFIVYSSAFHHKFYLHVRGALVYISVCRSCGSLYEATVLIHQCNRRIINMNKIKVITLVLLAGLAVGGCAYHHKPASSTSGYVVHHNNNGKLGKLGN